MEQTIKINVPEGKIAKYNEKTQTIEFVDKEPVRSKSWEEFCKKHPITSKEYYIDYNGKIDSIDDCDRQCANNLASEEDAEGILALIQLTRLHDEWVGDWKPTAKKDYFAIAYNLVYNKVTIGQWLTIQQTLSFPTKEMAEKFLKCFEDLIEKAKKFL